MTSKFGKEFAEQWPIDQPKYSEFAKKLLENCKTVQVPNKLQFKELIENSNEFPIEFPINSCRISNQNQNQVTAIEEQAASAYPVIHERVLWLFLNFLEYKCKYGNRIEKDVYSNLSLIDFIQRLLTKRCVSFVGKYDNYLLITGEQGRSGFVEIGTELEKKPLILKNCLSYSEIKLSALLSVSSHSEFLNNGTRGNSGQIEIDKSKIETNGVIIGIIGARLSRPELMEFQDIIINKTQNTIENGYAETNSIENSDIMKNWEYRRIWNEFYNENGKLFVNIRKDEIRYGNSRNENDIFDNLLMKKRYTISFDTLLLESEARAAKANKKGFIHVIGIGLGVWRTSEQQEEIFLETFAQRLKSLLPTLNHISYVHFSWFKLNECGDIKNGNCFQSKTHPSGGIRIFISNRNPADKLKGPEFENTLLIVSYAWDGNALPGNEFWMGSLSSTGDPAAACSTLISELHNPFINKTKVSGNNLHIASESEGVIHISEYAKRFNFNK